MGNNCLKPRAVTWLDEEDLEQLEVFKRKITEEKRRKSTEEYSSLSETTVKIKITKRQLEEILRLSTKKDQLPMELLLSSLVNSDNTGVFLSDEKMIMSKWRPKLQTIAEQDDELSNGTIVAS